MGMGGLASLVSLVRVGGPCSLSGSAGGWEMIGVTVEVGMELDIWYRGLTGMAGMETNIEWGGAGVVVGRETGWAGTI